MKSKLLITIACALALFSSCELVPDLNPATSSGSLVSVGVVNDVLITDNVLQDRSYDIDNNGANDIFFTKLVMDVVLSETYSHFLRIENGQILTDLSGVPHYGTHLSTAPVIGIWIPSTPVALSNSNALIGNIDWNIPNGTRYIFYKKSINNQDYFGWIELQSSVNNNPGPYNGRKNSTITRIAIADQPGVILKAGQTE